NSSTVTRSSPKSLTVSNPVRAVRLLTSWRLSKQVLNAPAKNGAGDRSSGSWQTFDMGERIVIAGASGLIGRELVTRFRARDAQVMKLVRRPPRQRDEVFWNPDGGIVPHDTLANATALISLNG